MSPIQEQQAVAEAPRPASSFRILFVDDDSLQATLGKRVLESVGYNVDIHVNPLEALAAVSANPEKYDLVITDQRMPDLVGAGLAEEVRAIRSNLSVMLLTGDAATLARSVELSQLFDMILPKPVSAGELRATVAAVLARAN